MFKFENSKLLIYSNPLHSGICNKVTTIDNEIFNLSSLSFYP